MNRPTIDQYLMLLAHVAALRSEDPYTKVGAVAADKHNRVIGTGYNGLSPGLKPPTGFWEDREGLRREVVCHAESNVLTQFKHGKAKTVAVSVLPCPACARSLVAHGVKRVLYGQLYWRDQSAFEVFKFHGLTCTEVVAPPITIPLIVTNDPQLPV